MAWFRKEKKPKEAVEKVAIPEGLWVKCDDCKEIVYRKEVEQNFNVCPKCGYHFRLTARERFEILFDDGKYKEFAGDIRSSDPLEFRDTKRYRDRLKGVRSARRQRRRRPLRRGEAGRHQRRHLRHGVQLHGRLDGIRRRREDHDRRRARAGEKGAAADRLHLRRRADAGRDPLADADGEDLRARWHGWPRPACPTSRS